MKPPGRVALITALTLGSIASSNEALAEGHPADDRAMGDGLAEYEAEAALRAAGGDPAASGGSRDLSSELDPQAATCAAGATTLGIDISKWQGDVNWNQVAAGGVKFAFVRVSHGINTLDQWFDSNWSEAHAAGLHVGVYQYFEPGQDPIAQADLLLERMGTLQPGDLPPVIDVESHGGLSSSAVAAAVTQWVNHVEAATGVKPIIYTGKYFWQDYVKTANFSGYPLWIAHYTNGCPNLPSQWGDWAVHQYTDKGSFNGVDGPTDTNHFNGDEAALAALAIGGGNGGGDGGGDGGGEEPPPAQGGCDMIVANGESIIDNGDDCYVFHGPDKWWRHVDGVGFDGDIVWTGTTKTTKTNWAEVVLQFEAAGDYHVEAHIPTPYNTSKQAKYKIQHAGGLASITANQSTKNGWVNLGDYTFDAGSGQSISLADATGEANSLGRKVVFDAFRITAIGDGARDGDGDGLGQSDFERGEGDGEASCSVAPRGRGAIWALGLALLGLRRRRD